MACLSDGQVSLRSHTHPIRVVRPATAAAAAEEAAGLAAPFPAAAAATVSAVLLLLAAAGEALCCFLPIKPSKGLLQLMGTGVDPRELACSLSVASPADDGSAAITDSATAVWDGGSNDGSWLSPSVTCCSAGRSCCSVMVIRAWERLLSGFSAVAVVCRRLKPW